MREFLLLSGIFIAAYSTLYWAVAPSGAQEAELAELAEEFTEACKGLRDPESIQELELRAWEYRQRIFFDPFARPWRCEWGGQALTDPLLM